MKVLARNVVLLLAAAAVVGCSEDKPTTGGNSPPTTTTGGVDIKIGNLELKTNQDQGTNIKVGNVEIQAGGGMKLPDDFPKDLPIYAGAVIKTHVLSKQGDHTTGMLHMEVPATVEKVSEFYRAELKSQGWTEAQHIVSESKGKTATIIGAKKGNRTLSVTVTVDKRDVTIVNLTVAATE